jgi:glycosyltransferase involved in cell wall biosynthesis
LITDLEIGGTPTIVRELAMRLRAPPEVEIEVACLKGWGPVADQIRSAGIEVTVFGARRAWQLPSVVRRLRRLVRERGIDTVFSFLVHANAVAALASRKLPGVRFIQSIQTTQSRPQWHWSVQRWAARRAEKIVVPSFSVFIVATQAADVAQQRLIIIPNAIDPPQFNSEGSVPSVEATEIGFLGRLDPVKRIADLVQAVSVLPPKFRLHIFGEGSERSKIQAEISRLNLHGRAILHGPVPRPQEALNKIGQLVLPSGWEGFGLVLIEAMAASVPVVATNALGIRDVVRHEENALVVRVGDVEALRTAIERIASDAALRHQLIENGLRTVRERYSWEVVLPQYRKLLSL